MRLEQLSEIIEIANTGSFSGAARNLFVSQPNLSRSVKKLEQELGFEIFVRKSDGVILTEKGISLIERARVIECECQQLSELYAGDKSNSRQSLRVATMCRRVTAYLPPMIPKYVGVPVDITYLNCTSLKKVFHLVETLQVDYAIMSILSPYINAMKNKIRNAGMEYNVIASSPLYAAIGPQNPLYGLADAICLHQLYPFTVISYRDIDGDPNHNYSVALGIENFLHSSIKTNNSKIFYQTIHETAAVGIVATPPDNFKQICEYDDLKLLALRDSTLFVEYIWTKLRRVPMSELAYEDLTSKCNFF